MLSQQHFLPAKLCFTCRGSFGGGGRAISGAQFQGGFETAFKKPPPCSAPRHMVPKLFCTGPPTSYFFCLERGDSLGPPWLDLYPSSRGSRGRSCVALASTDFWSCHYANKCVCVGVSGCTKPSCSLYSCTESNASESFNVQFWGERSKLSMQYLTQSISLNGSVKAFFSCSLRSGGVGVAGGVWEGVCGCFFKKRYRKLLGLVRPGQGRVSGEGGSTFGGFLRFSEPPRGFIAVFFVFLSSDFCNVLY